MATIATLLMARVRFGIHGLKTEEERAESRRMVAGFDENENVPSHKFFWFSVAVLVAFIGGMAGQSALPWKLFKLEMGFIALFFAGIVLLAYKAEVDKFYQTVDWDLLGFFAALFVVIHVMEDAHVLGAIGGGISSLLDLPQHVDSGVLLLVSALASSVTDNIPLAAVLANILDDLKDKDPEGFSSAYWWCVIFGANLGGNITPIGSASTVVAFTIIHRQKLQLGFMDFVKIATPFAAVQLVIAIAYVLTVSVLFADAAG
jgi:Na+/H+ antiporter NhaD/arsenite permease-like protein